MVIKKINIIGIFIFLSIFLLSFASGAVVAWKDSYCADCTLPWNEKIHSDLSVTAYLTNTVPCLSTCSSETRVCNNGTLSGTYANKTCTMINCLNCTVSPWGTIVHGSSVTAYPSSTNDSIACGSTCTLSQTRTCNNGALNGTYPYSSCTGTCASCSLPWPPYNIILSGESVTAYSTSSVACGSTCTSETRTCSDGKWSGSYAYSSCTPVTCTLPQTCGGGGTPNVCGCTPSCDCASSTCIGSTCSNGCGGSCDGTKNCYTVIPNYGTQTCNTVCKNNGLTCASIGTDSSGVNTLVKDTGYGSGPNHCDWVWTPSNQCGELIYSCGNFHMSNSCGNDACLTYNQCINSGYGFDWLPYTNGCGQNPACVEYFCGFTNCRCSSLKY